MKGGNHFGMMIMIQFFSSQNSGVLSAVAIQFRSALCLLTIQVSWKKLKFYLKKQRNNIFFHLCKKHVTWDRLLNNHWISTTSLLGMLNNFHGVLRPLALWMYLFIPSFLKNQVCNSNLNGRLNPSVVLRIGLIKSTWQALKRILSLCI